MTQATEQDAWTETFLITVQEIDGTARDFRAIVTTYDISGGDKDFTSIANAKGGRIKNFSVQTDYEITMEGYATQVGTVDGGATGEGFFDLMFTSDTSQPYSVSMDHNRSLQMLSIMHTTSTSQASAIAVTADGDRASRDTFKNGHFTSVNQSFTDGICKFTFKFKSAPFDKESASNVTFESTDGSSTKTLPAQTYTA